jgi:uncharacterized membrane protein
MAERGSPVHVQALPRNDDEQEPTGNKRLPARRWLRHALLVLGPLAVLPWLAPIFVAAGWWGLADPIYTAYMFLCHQLPERAPFLFGYQVAFCWRNAAIYTGLFGFGLLYALSTMPRSSGRGSHAGSSLITHLLARLPRAIPLWVYLLTLAPLALDGLSHMLGLRDGLFDNSTPSFGSFLVGSQFLSLNWWLRILTGLLAAFGTVWFAFPRLDKYMVLAALAHAPREMQRAWRPWRPWRQREPGRPLRAHRAGSAGKPSRPGRRSTTPPGARLRWLPPQPSEFFPRHSLSRYSGDPKEALRLDG